jgi:hypothetical protein
MDNTDAMNLLTSEFDTWLTTLKRVHKLPISNETDALMFVSFVAGHALGLHAAATGITLLEKEIADCLESVRVRPLKR